MKINIKTLVNKSMQDVWLGFDEKLFRFLSPPFPKVEIERFDGCLKGDEVHLKLLFPFFPQYWFAEIVENSLSENEIYFIDKGTKLPFFLSDWQHKHRIVKVNETQSAIIDSIEFKTGTLISDWAVYPALYLQFLMRKPLYKKYFND